MRNQWRTNRSKLVELEEGGMIRKPAKKRAGEAMATAAEGLSRGGALNADLSSRQKAFYIQSYYA